MADYGSSTPLKKRLILWCALLLAGFLIGFVPQYVQARQLRAEAEAANQQLENYRSRARASDLKDLIGLAYLETSRKNYGLAGQYASQFFNVADEMMNQAQNEKLRLVLQQALGQRDAITAGLAKGDSTIHIEVERIFQETIEASRQQSL